MTRFSLGRLVRPSVLAVLVVVVVLLGLGGAAWAMPSLGLGGNNIAGTVPMREADLSISMSGDRKGDTISIKIRVKNNGPVAAEKVVVSGSVPSGLSYASSQGNCKVKGSSFECKLGNISANGGSNLSISGKLKAKARVPELKASGSVSSKTRDPVSSNNKAKTTIK
jgi:uncharacterized repeat protein (TIGR01451 family)